MFINKLDKDTLLKPLQVVAGVVERKSTMPILSNVLIEHRNGQLSLTATDMEIQITTQVASGSDDGVDMATTIGAKKLQDVLRVLPEQSTVSIELADHKATVKTNKSRFQLQTLPAEDFPTMEQEQEASRSITLTQNVLKKLLTSVSYAMAQQDVRYYLNGVLLLIEGDFLKVVATDGHRLAYNAEVMGGGLERQQIIVPRKAILELSKVLADNDDPIRLDFGSQQLKASFNDTVLVSKIIDGKFPDYNRVIPKHQTSLNLDRLSLLQALQRATVVTSNDKVRGVRFLIENNKLSIVSHNSEQEQAEEEIEINYEGVPVDIGFNVSYLMDALSNVTGETIAFYFGDVNQSVLITTPDAPELRYVVMPMRI